MEFVFKQCWNEKVAVRVGQSGRPSSCPVEMTPCAILCHLCQAWLQLLMEMEPEDHLGHKYSPSHKSFSNIGVAT